MLTHVHIPKYLPLFFFYLISHMSFGQDKLKFADSLKSEGLLVPALTIYAESMETHPTPELAYQIASITALLWTSQMRDTSFHFLNYALKQDSTLDVLHDPDFLSLIDDPRWNQIEDAQFDKYEAANLLSGSLGASIFLFYYSYSRIFFFFLNR